jgi:tetratricopeptide (TPR) repeat protein
VIHANAWLSAERVNILACVDARIVPADLPVMAGRLLRRLSYWPEGVHCYQRALTISRQTGNRSGEADALRGLAHADRARGRHAAARERFEQAIDVCRDLGDRLGEAHASWGLGRVAKATEDIDTAGQHWREALQLFETLRIPFAKTVRDALAGLRDRPN